MRKMNMTFYKDDKIKARVLPNKEIQNFVKRKNGKIFCSAHVDEDVNFYCRKCGILVCNECVDLYHRSHETYGIKSQAAEEQKWLSKTLPGIKKNVIPSLRDNIKRIKESRLSTKTEFNKLLEQINMRSAELIKDINAVRDLFIHECKINQEKTATFLNETESKILQGIGALEKSVKSCEDAMRNSNLSADIVYERMELDSNLEQSPNTSLKLGFPNFNSGITDRDILTEIFGNLQGNFKRDLDTAALFSKQAKISKKLKLNTVSSFRYKTDIRAMCIIDSNSAWLAPISQYHELVKVDRGGKELDRIHTNFLVYDITINSNNELLATNSEKTSLMQIMPDGTQKEVAELPLRPRGLSACKNGELLLCLCDSVDFPIHNEGKRQVVRMDKKYNIKLTIEKYKGDKQFTLPDKVAENINGDICVIDRTGGGNSHLCVFSNGGKYLFCYPDVSPDQQELIPGTVHKKHSFRDVCCDTLGNIIISDEKCNEIVVLTRHGAQKCLLTQRLLRSGVNIAPHFYRPSCLELDSEGKLWVLQKQGVTVVDLYSQLLPINSKKSSSTNTSTPR